MRKLAGCNHRFGRRLPPTFPIKLSHACQEGQPHQRCRNDLSPSVGPYFNMCRANVIHGVTFPISLWELGAGG